MELMSNKYVKINAPGLIFLTNKFETGEQVVKCCFSKQFAMLLLWIGVVVGSPRQGHSAKYGKHCSPLVAQALDFNLNF